MEEGTNKLWYIYVMGYYSVTKMSKWLMHTTRVKLKSKETVIKERTLYDPDLYEALG